jgi:hypothetical protein
LNDDPMPKTTMKYIEFLMATDRHISRAAIL